MTLREIAEQAHDDNFDKCAHSGICRNCMIDAIERVAKEEKAKGKRWLRHSKDCVAGKHCEDPFCHHDGECSCGLDTYLAAERGE